MNKALCKSTVPNLSLIGIALLLTSVTNIVVSCCGGCIVIRLKADMKENGYTKTNKSQDTDRMDMKNMKNMKNTKDMD